VRPVVLDAAAIDDVIPRLDAVSAMRKLFAGFGNNRVAQPPQTLALLPGRAGGGDFIAYLAAIADPPVFGVKVSPYLPSATGSIVTAWTLLMSSETGTPLMLCDAMALTRERTAATTALAVDLLAPADATRLTVIGTGSIGRAHLRHVLPLRAWRNVRVWSPNAASRTELIRSVAPTASIERTLHDATEGAEVILLCTSAASAIIDPAKMPQCKLVTSISTNAYRAHEIPPQSLSRLDVYCDARANAPLAAGEMLIAREDLGWDPAAICGDLAELVSGTAKLPTRTAFFRSIGLGCEDIALAAAVHDRISLRGETRA